MNYRKYNDYELIYMVRENDDISRDVLYEKYSPIIKSIVNEFYSSYSCYGYEYDDFFQEAIIAFENAINNYNEYYNSLFYSFVVICIRRKLISFTRNISNQSKNISNYNLVELNEELIPSRDIVSDYIFSLEVGNVFKSVINDLPLKNSVVFELKINGFSYREISILLDIPISSAEYRFRIAKKCLKKRLSNFIEK